jgi:hypothetical protein
MTVIAERIGVSSCKKCDGSDLKRNDDKSGYNIGTGSAKIYGMMMMTYQLEMLTSLRLETQMPPTRIRPRTYPALGGGS